MVSDNHAQSVLYELSDIIAYTWPLSMDTRIKFQYVGILAVIGLTVFVTYNDIMRLFGQ